MASTMNRAVERQNPLPSRIIILDANPESSSRLGDLLSDHGQASSRIETAAEAENLIKLGGFDLLIHRPGDVADGDLAVYRAARGRGIPVLLVVDEPPAHRPDWRWDGPIAEADDWLDARSLETELQPRAARLIARRFKAEGAAGQHESTSKIQLDPEFFAIVIHDLRTPLNVMYLSELMIRQAIPRGNKDTDEDLKALDENCRQMERMLAQLTEFFRLFESNIQLASAPFSPKRLADEVLEARTVKPDLRQGPVVLEIDPSCPDEVHLDPLRARLALQFALVNATSSSAGKPVKMIMRGGEGRWEIALKIDHPPPAQIKSIPLNSRSFTRLCGFAADRRGMDLAIVARVSELFGGSARLEVVEQTGTTIVIDWPVELPG